MGKKQPNEEVKPGIREKLGQALEMPRDIVMNVPKLTLTGNSELVIENYKGIIEYDDTVIRVNTTVGVMRIIGKKLVISTITDDEIWVTGIFRGIEYFC